MTAPDVTSPSPSPRPRGATWVGDWVLVTDDGQGQARSAVAAVRALSLAGYRVATAVSGPRSLGAASRHCIRAVPVPPVSDPGYATAVREELFRLDHLTVLPSSDDAALALGAPVAHMVDKARLAHEAEAAGLAVVPIQPYATVDELRDSAQGLRYPAVVKAATSRAFPTRRVDGPTDLRDLPGDVGPVVVQPYVEAPLMAVAGVARGGRLLAAVHQRYERTWPPDCGTASSAVTTAPDLDLEEPLLDLLSGYDGIFQAQFVGRRLVDLNPRVYGSLPLAVAAGANLCAIHCRALAGDEPTGTVRARPGVRYRWLEGDIRHVVSAVRRGRMGLGAALLTLAPRRGSAHSVESLWDPGPQLTRLRHGLASLTEGRIPGGAAPDPL